jgi:hypothetical protein
MDFLKLLLVYAIPIGVFAAVFSALARWRGMALSVFWATPIGAVLPWLAVTVLALVASMFVKVERQQAAGMSVLLPMLVTMGLAVLACIISLLLSPTAQGLGIAKTRLIWAFGLSAVPALLCLWRI